MWFNAETVLSLTYNHVIEQCPSLGGTMPLDCMVVTVLGLSLHDHDYTVAGAFDSTVCYNTVLIYI